MWENRCSQLCRVLIIMHNLSTTILGTKTDSPNKEIKMAVIRCSESLYASLTGLFRPLRCSVRAYVTPKGLTLPLCCPDWACISPACFLLPLHRPWWALAGLSGSCYPCCSGWLECLCRKSIGKKEFTGQR